ncbi:hypothetical protein ALC57_08655, partial [Trachymyrmex cornetzi]
NMDVSKIATCCTFTFFALISLVMLFGYCLTGDQLTQQCLNVQNAYYECDWYEMPLGCKKSLLICMIRGQVMLHLTAGKFYIFSLNSFTDVILSMKTEITCAPAFVYLTQFRANSRGKYSVKRDVQIILYYFNFIVLKYLYLLFSSVIVNDREITFSQINENVTQVICLVFQRFHDTELCNCRLDMRHVMRIYNDCSASIIACARENSYYYSYLQSIIKNYFYVLFKAIF